MARNFGIMSSRASLGGTSTDAAATRDEIHSRDPVIEYLKMSERDHELAARVFALVALASPFAITGLAVTIWVLFFQ